jgi:Tol biopolymer transport system component
MHIRRFIKVVLGLVFINLYLIGCAGNSSPTPEQNFTPIDTTISTDPDTDIVRSFDINSELCLIAYMQFAESGADIFGMDCKTDPYETFQLTSIPGVAYEPQWSPDLQYIAFLHYKLEGDTSRFYVIDNINNADYREISDTGVSINPDFSWSADSQYLVYSGQQTDGMDSDVYRMNVDTGETMNLTADSLATDFAPAVSPRGDLIAFISDRSLTEIASDNIWVMAIDGSGVRNVTESSGWEDFAPAWSPDGSTIVFYRGGLTEGDGAGGPSGLWLVDPLTGEEQLLLEIERLLGGFEAPAWSPDGRYIALQYGLPGNADIYVLNLSDGSTVNVSQLSGHDSAISWSPDSQYLIFTNVSEDGRNYRIHITSPEGGARPLLLEYGNSFGHWAQSSPISE